MKKSILIGALAVMMLFAFTACEQTPIDVIGKEVSFISVQQTGDFVEGQPFDASKFDLVVNYKNSAAPDVVNGVGYVAEGSDWDTTGEVTINFLNLSDFTYYATIYEIEGIKVVVPEDPSYTNDDLANSCADIKETLDVSVIYDGDKELPIAAADYTLTDNGNNTITVKETLSDSSNGFSYTYSFTKVNVESGSLTNMTGYTVTYDETKVLYRTELEAFKGMLKITGQTPYGEIDIPVASCTVVNETSFTAFDDLDAHTFQVYVTARKDLGAKTLTVTAKDYFDTSSIAVNAIKPVTATTDVTLDSSYFEVTGHNAFDTATVIRGSVTAITPSIVYATDTTTKNVSVTYSIEGVTGTMDSVPVTISRT